VGGRILFFAPTNPEIQSEINLWNLWQKEITITIHMLPISITFQLP